jgi:hypothetical protein
MGIHLEEQIASLLSGGGLIFAVYVGTRHLTSIQNFLLPLGPLEICAVGVVMWLHAKWRRATSMNR